MPTFGDSVMEIWNGLSPELTATCYTTSFVIVVVTILWLLSSLSTYFQANAKGRLPPGSLGLPVIGETVQFSLNSMSDVGYREWVRKKAKKYGPFFKTHLLGTPVVFMDAPAGNKFVFQNEGKLMQNEWPASVAKLLGPYSLTMKQGEEYKIARRHFSSFLDHAAVLRYLEVLERNVVQHFAKHWSGKDELPAVEMMKKFTFTTICTLLISLGEGPEMDELRAYFKSWSSGVLRIPVRLPGFAYHAACKARIDIMGWFHKFMTQRRQELAEGPVSESSKVDLLTSLLTSPDENGRFLSDPEIADNLLLLLYAGYDTSSGTLAMTMYYLAKNPQVYEQLLQEHKEIVERKREKEESNALTPEDLSAMKYTWRVLQESIRLQPPVAGTFRVAITDIEYNGYTIPKGWKIMWNNQQSHYDTMYFPDSLTFNPSRWETPPTPFTFVAFGGGTRTCPGYEFARIEMLVFVHHLLRRYQWTLVDPDEPIMRDPFPRTKKNIPIRITKISSF